MSTRSVIVRDLPADLETPLSAYWKLAHDEPYSFLLESVTGGEKLARYSLIGVRPSTILRARERNATISQGAETRQHALPDGEDALHLLQSLTPALPREILPDSPRLIGGAIGVLAYDFVRSLEKLPDNNPDALGLEDALFFICDTILVFDHARSRIRLIAQHEATPDGEMSARAELERLQSRLGQGLPALPAAPRKPAPEMTPNLSQEEFEAVVRRAIAYTGAGDCVQVVPSVRWSGAFQSHPVTLYRALRSLNPSPYMFLFRFGTWDLVGASPELLVSLTYRQARVRPIAGTAKRGLTPAEDNANAEALLANEKERSEHVMLVDLGRNDVGRVAEIGTVTVPDLMVIERYSHVMHIVSDVVGTLKKELNGYDLVRAAFPAGTLSGAPKIRAMQIIDELEPVRRGLYGGAVGYFSSTGDVDLAIAIRSVVLKDGQAHVQAGAGIVFDSNPTSEWHECQNKASAPLKALALAHEGD